ncbi:MAG: 2-C-methyl-D-erythritol 2,4-cyclodiphosphate synthase [Gammaproteobacteria bacterium]|nr:2-C-methyl-D-erythritol 2,4-cyclodiphosphate synthase [Gammaproteobacteria bacterium]NNJ49042.1 2-C-methyl-D-erythritol 2,4-cyclodiphosphate synthase [Gammaproteobacteria bacterium]
MNNENDARLPPYRIGHGYDVHRFGEGDHIVLGGVKIPYQYGFIAHSDGDVLIHAICDAMLGAIAAGDIGQHFPDTDARYKDIESSVLLDNTFQLLKHDGYDVVNIDCTIIAQSPKMSPHISAMSQNLCAVLNIAPTQINIKATTTESLGFAGREEGIAVHAVVMLYRMSG